MLTKEQAMALERLSWLLENPGKRLLVVSRDQKSADDLCAQMKGLLGLKVTQP